MRRNRLWIGAVVVLMLAAASAVALADFGGNGPPQDLNIIKGPPAGGGCICPANWAPVVCTASDGSRHGFSNECVASCYGYSNCPRIVVPQ